MDHTKIRTALYCARGWILDREDSTPMISYHALLDENTYWINTGGIWRIRVGLLECGNAAGTAPFMYGCERRTS